MSIVINLDNQLAQASNSEFLEHLRDAVTRRTRGMDDPSDGTESDIDLVISFLTMTMASRNQHHAEKPTNNAWHRPMEEVSVAPQYRFTTFGSSPPQAVAADSSSPAAATQPSTDDTAALLATISQLKEDNTKSETKQEELQNQMKTFQMSVTSLTATS